MPVLELFIDEAHAQELAARGETEMPEAQTPYGPMPVRIHVGQLPPDDTEYFWAWPVGIETFTATSIFDSQA